MEPNIYTRILERRRQIYDIDERLTEKKESSSRLDVSFQQREERLRVRDQELKATLLRFNSTIAENESKRARADKKALDDKAATVAKEREHAALLAQHAAVTAVRHEALKRARAVCCESLSFRRSSLSRRPDAGGIGRARRDCHKAAHASALGRLAAHGRRAALLSWLPRIPDRNPTEPISSA